MRTNENLIVGGTIDSIITENADVPFALITMMKDEFGVAQSWLFDMTNFSSMGIFSYIKIWKERCKFEMTNVGIITRGMRESSKDKDKERYKLTMVKYRGQNLERWGYKKKYRTIPKERITQCKLTKLEKYYMSSDGVVVTEILVNGVYKNVIIKPSENNKYDTFKYHHVNDIQLLYTKDQQFLGYAVVNETPEPNDPLKRFRTKNSIVPITIEYIDELNKVEDRL